MRSNSSHRTPPPTRRTRDEDDDRDGAEKISLFKTIRRSHACQIETPPIDTSRDFVFLRYPCPAVVTKGELVMLHFRRLVVPLLALLFSACPIPQPATAQVAKPAATSPAATSPRTRRHQHRDQGPTQSSSGNRRRLRRQDHRRPPLHRQKSTHAKEDSSASNLQQNPVHDHRQAFLTSGKCRSCFRTRLGAPRIKHRFSCYATCLHIL